ncbi:hypothetical protein AgCh_020073 [Apium graveolens]
MVLNANDLLEWKDFPKGLRVLLLEQESDSASETRSKLEEMDYIVSVFYNETEALSAISNSAEGFHVAIVEVSSDNSDGRFKFLETAKDLPTIMTSNMHCLSTTMKCIALGAVEFLRKPLSEEKIKNIWQHVLHKAFNAGGKDISESVKPLRESVTLPQLCLGNGESNHQLSVKIEYNNQNQELSAGSDKYPAPSTPQIKRGERLLDDGDCQDQANIIADKDGMEPDVESKSVENTLGLSVAETTYGNIVAESTVQATPSQGSGDGDFRPEDQLANDSKDKSIESSLCSDKGIPMNTSIDTKTNSKASRLRKICGFKASRKKAKKYRMQQRHILPKDRNYGSRKPVMVFPSYQNTSFLPGGQGYQGWVPPSSYPAGVQMWGAPYYPAWQTTENWHWTPYPAMHADAWGCPVMPPPPVGPCPPYPQSTPQCQNSDYLNISQMPDNLFDLCPAEEEVIDKVVKEAISKPWLPLPLGLKPPSTDSVLNELSKQGISSVPPHHTQGTHLH